MKKNKSVFNSLWPSKVCLYCSILSRFVERHRSEYCHQSWMSMELCEVAYRNHLFSTFPVAERKIEEITKQLLLRICTHSRTPKFARMVIYFFL